MLVVLTNLKFLNNHLARVLNNPKQQEKQKKREKILSRAVAQDVVTSACDVSDLVDVELSWKNPEFEVYAVFWPGIENPIPPRLFGSFQIGGSVENPILLDNEEDKENSPPTSPVPERPNRPPALLRSRSFGTRIEKVRDYVYRNLSQ